MITRHFLNASLFSLYKLNRMANSMANARPSSDFASFRNIFKEAKNIVVLTGAGVSAESGIPTYRGAGGLWRKYDATSLATPGAFRTKTSLVWEFYHHRREVAFSKVPNEAHKAIAECQSRLAEEGKKLTVITQNVDGLHQKAGTKKVIELHGAISKTKCTKCRDVAENFDSPICPALEGKGEPDPNAENADIPEEDLPRCKKAGCGGLLRPAIIWYGERLDQSVLNEAYLVLSKCDLCIVVGTSFGVYPAAVFAPEVARKGVPVAEFNLECVHNLNFNFFFEGPCTKTLPPALAP